MSFLLGLMLEWQWLIFIGGALALGITFYSCYLAYLYNQRNLYVAIPVALGKFVLGGLFVLTWIEILYPNGQTVSRRREQRTTALLFLGLLTPLIYLLVNGESVYLRKGWEWTDREDVIN